MKETCKECSKTEETGENKGSWKWTRHFGTSYNCGDCTKKNNEMARLARSNKKVKGS